MKKTDALIIGADESPVAYCQRMAGIGTAAAAEAAETATTSDDDRLRLQSFDGRIVNSAMVGWSMIARATAKDGTAPAKFAVAAKAVDVPDQGTSTYLGRRYSTLKECYAIAMLHTEVRYADFVSAYRTAHGASPENVRAYVQWLNADAAGGAKAAVNTTETLAKRKAAAAKALASAKAGAAAKVADTARLVKARDAAPATGKPVPGCPLTKTQWMAMDEATLRAVALLAESMRSAKAEAARKGGAAAKAGAAAGETGPTPARKAKTKVAS